MNAQEDLESSLETSHHRSVSRMTWARIRHQFEQRVQDLCTAGKNRDEARKAALDAGALRSFMSELLTRCSREAVREFLRTRSDWGTGAALIEKDWSVASLIDQMYPVATWTALDPLDAGSAADNTRWAAWVQAWHDEFRRDDKPHEEAHARVFGHSPRATEGGVHGRRDDMFDGVVLKPELSPTMKSVLNWGALIATFFVNLADEEDDDEDEEVDRRTRRWTRRPRAARKERPHPLDEVLKDGGVEMPRFVDIVGQFLGGTPEAHETAEMIARSPDPHKLLRVFVERFANPRERGDEGADEASPPQKEPPHEAASARPSRARAAPPCTPPPPPGGVPKWAEKLDAHLRAGGLGHIADTAQVSAASPGTESTPPPDGDLAKLLETVADKAAARAVQAIRPMIEKYTATVEKALAEQRDEMRSLNTQMRDQEARLRHLEEEFRVLHAEVEKSKIADAESKARAPSILEEPQTAPIPEPISAVSAEPAAVTVEAAPVVEAEVVEDVPSKQGTDDSLHAAAELEKLAGVTGLRSALGDVQQGIGDLKARAASNDSLIKEMEARLAQARKQKEEASAAP